MTRRESIVKRTIKECRSPYCECEENKCKYGLKDMRENQARKNYPNSPFWKEIKKKGE